MKQVISIADFATILNVINDKIQTLEHEANFLVPWVNPMRDIITEEKRKKQIEKNLRELKKNTFYQSLIHAKKALEECKVEIEVPDLEVKDERN